MAINWLELRILGYLRDRGHAMPIADLEVLAPGSHVSTVTLTFDMGLEGWVNIFETQGGIKMAQITPAGRDIIFRIMANSNRSCD